MPIKTPNGMKPTSPSKVVQANINNNWGKQEGTTSPQQALADKATRHPYPVNGNKK